MNAPDKKPLSQRYYEKSEEWVDAEAAASIMENTRSAVRSQMMMTKGEMPVNKAEMLVLASEEWMTFNREMVEARRKANLLKAQREFLHMKFHERNSNEATQRLEMRMTR